MPGAVGPRTRLRVASRAFRPQLLPEVEHRPLGLGPRRQHSTVVIAGRQLRMRPTRRYGSWNEDTAAAQCSSAPAIGVAARASEASAGAIGSPTRISPPTRILARSPPP